MEVGEGIRKITGSGKIYKNKIKGTESGSILLRKVKRTNKKQLNSSFHLASGMICKSDNPQKEHCQSLYYEEF